MAVLLLLLTSTLTVRGSTVGSSAIASRCHGMARQGPQLAEWNCTSTVSLPGRDKAKSKSAAVADMASLHGAAGRRAWSLADYKSFAVTARGCVLWDSPGQYNCTAGAAANSVAIGAMWARFEKVTRASSALYFPLGPDWREVAGVLRTEGKR